MDITFIEEFWANHQGLCNVIVLVLVFGGMGRIAFWREQDGLRVGGPLAVGLAALLTVATLTWARQEGKSVADLGPWAAFIIVEAILIMGWAALRKSTKS